MRSEFWEALGYCVTPVEGCPGPSLGNIPRILWSVQDRGCPSSEAWEWGGGAALWLVLCPERGCGRGAQAGLGRGRCCRWGAGPLYRGICILGCGLWGRLVGSL